MRFSNVPFSILYVMIVYYTVSIDSYSWFSPFLPTASKLFGGIKKDKKSSMQIVSAIITKEEKQVANMIASSIIRDAEQTRSSPPSSLNVNIREASYADLLSVSSLRVNVFYPELVTNGAFHTRILEKLRVRKDDGAVCLIAMENAKSSDLGPTSYHYPYVLGTVEFSPADFKNTSMEFIGDSKKLYAMDLAVRKCARRYGLATRLLNSIEIYAANHGYREVYLHVEVENEAARYLYAKCGYVEVDLVENEWAREFTSKRLHKPPDSYVFLYKSLSAASQRQLLMRQSEVLANLISQSQPQPYPNNHDDLTVAV